MENSGSLVCTHHFAKSSSVSQNGRPDLSEHFSLTVPTSIPETSQCEEEEYSSSENLTPSDNSSQTNSVGRENENLKTQTVQEKAPDGSKEETETHPSSAPNPFDESDEEEEEQSQPSAEAADVNLSLTSGVSEKGDSRPIPAPRKVSESSLSARPVPRPRPPRPPQSPTVNGELCSGRLALRFYHCTYITMLLQ